MGVKLDDVADDAEANTPSVAHSWNALWEFNYVYELSTSHVKISPKLLTPVLNR